MIFNMEAYKSGVGQLIDVQQRFSQTALDRVGRLTSQSMALSRASGEAYANYGMTLADLTVQRWASALNAKKS